MTSYRGLFVLAGVMMPCCHNAAICLPPTSAAWVSPLPGGVRTRVGRVNTRAHAQGRPALITSARPAHSLDANARNKRYLWTMAVRVACFLGGVLSPTPWNWVLFVGAAVIPPVAVALANAVDLRRTPEVAEDPSAALKELPPETVVPGSVEDDPAEDA